MSVERGPKSLHEHNKSLLYSNRPKFKEHVRENIHVDRIREDRVEYEQVNQENLKRVLAQIKQNARREVFRQLKILVVSIFITAIILFYLKDYLDHQF